MRSHERAAHAPRGSRARPARPPAARHAPAARRRAARPPRRERQRRRAPRPRLVGRRPRTRARGGDAASHPARRGPRHAGREHTPGRARHPGLAPPRRRGRGAGRARRAARASRRRGGGRDRRRRARADGAGPRHVAPALRERRAGAPRCRALPVRRGRNRPGGPMKRTLPHGLPFAPVKVGVLIDIDMGTKEDFLATLRMGFEEAHEECVVTRAVELVVKEAIGLPRLEAKNTTDGYLELVRHGVLCVLGPLITDHSIALAPVIARGGVPAVTWSGIDRYHGEFCFNLGNGGLAEEAAMMAAWIRRPGHRTVGMIHELSPGGVEYASNFRYYAARAGLDVLIEAYTTQVPDDLEAVLRKVRDQRPNGLAYLGYGCPTIVLGPVVDDGAWD